MQRCTRSAITFSESNKENRWCQSAKKRTKPCQSLQATSASAGRGADDQADHDGAAPMEGVYVHTRSGQARPLSVKPIEVNEAQPKLVGHGSTPPLKQGQRLKAALPIAPRKRGSSLISTDTVNDPAPGCVADSSRRQPKARVRRALKMLEGRSQSDAPPRQPLPMNRQAAGASLQDNCHARKAAPQRVESPPFAHVTRRRRLSLEGTARCLAALDLKDKGI